VMLHRKSEIAQAFSSGYSELATSCKMYATKE